jgi:hypothetical protein
MKPMRQKTLLVLGCLILVVARVLAQEQCSEFLQTALATVEQSCAGLARNQACFGNIDLTAVGQPDASNFQFSNVGDITDVAAIQSMQLSGYDPENGLWGVVMMQLQADIPNTLPGQNVTVILFGDVAVQNAAESVLEQIPPEQEQTIQATSNVNIRSFPSANASIIGTIAPNVSIIATGRSEDSQWIRVRFGVETGWIFAELLGSELDTSTLIAVTKPEVPLTTPMQAFYLTAGIGRPSCNEVPDDGMMVQTPEGTASINLYVNQVSVQMGSTVYFSINEDGDMEIAPIEGSARIESDDEDTTVVEGGYVEVPLDENFIPDGPPSDPQSYLGDEDIEDLPIDALERDVEPDLGLTQEELQELEELQPILDYVNVEDADDLFNYVEETEDPNLVNYLIEEGYTDFGNELEDYIEEDLGYDLDDYANYTGDDIYIDNSYTDADGDGIVDSQDNFVDADNDGIVDSEDTLVDADGDGIDDAYDDWVDADGNGYDDRYGNGAGAGTDADGDGIDDGADDWVDTDGNGYDDRYGNGDTGGGDGGGGGSGVDADGDGIDDSVDDWVDTDGNGYDDRYGNGDTGGGDGGGGGGGNSCDFTDLDGDCIEDSVDDWIDVDGNGIDDRSE